MDESFEKKESLYSSIINAIGKLFPKRKKPTSIEFPSRFRIMMQDITEDDPEYENVSKAADLCSESLKIARQRIQLVSQISAIEEQMVELEAYSKLTDKEAHTLKNMLESFVSTTKDRNVLRYQLTDFDQGLARMETLEKDANLAIPQIQDAEYLQRVLKHDIGHLSGEKSDLEYERELLETSLNFINKLSIVVVSMLGIATIYLGYLFIFTGRSIFYPSTVLVVAAIIMATGLYMFRRQVSYDLKINIKKQKRAIELLNKKNAVLAHYTNFLNYEYKKYKVRNSQMLQANLKEFGHYKYVTGRIDAIRNIMYETEKNIEIFLREKKIDSGRFTIEQFANTINVEDKQMFYNGLTEKKAEYEEKLAILDENHKSMWESLDQLCANDNTEDKIISLFMQIYFDEVDKLMTGIDIQKDVV